MERQYNRGKSAVLMVFIVVVALVVLVIIASNIMGAASRKAVTDSTQDEYQEYINSDEFKQQQKELIEASQNIQGY